MEPCSRSRATSPKVELCEKLSRARSAVVLRLSLPPVWLAILLIAAGARVVLSKYWRKSRSSDTSICCAGSTLSSRTRAERWRLGRRRVLVLRRAQRRRAVRGAKRGLEASRAQAATEQHRGAGNKRSNGGRTGDTTGGGSGCSVMLASAGVDGNVCSSCGECSSEQ
eukprot:5356104-Prymnesium_polylepis.5